ncbi:MFS transporter [Streptomyces sp. AV19]|uniref:MFS transporter n=1 Tax=Streptomyces sp. AV19 TaxID=2793068 RepID=UPI0018FE740A|nr:MFS transporter [Streptomyces sp. AV19]MBH1935529.1 MFS transporter [Streptomyces sp. AV19]MDG4534417.1 MFS transporter [Streptomyces sp. AV19]
MSATTPAKGPAGRRWVALAAIVLCMLTLGFDTTILNVALPTMASELGADASQLQWIADSYLVVFAALMLPAGLLGDRFGRRRMLVTGLLVFLAGSLVGSLADDSTTVIAARAAMGAGAALVMPLAMAVLPSLFGPEELTRAVGALSAATGLGLPLGPLLGGFLLDHFWWGSVFLINLPLIGLAVAACLLLLPETTDPATPTVNVLTAALAVTGLGALVYGVNEGPGSGWSSPPVLGALAAAVVLLALLVVRERRLARPMLDLALLARPGFLWNTVAAALVMFTMTGLLFVLPSYLQTVQGHDAFGTGLRMVPMPLGMLVASRAVAPLVRRTGPRPAITGGLVVMAVAALLGSRTDVHDGYGWTALWLTLVGVGFGAAVIPAMDGALGSLPRERAGVGSGLLMTLRQVASAIGLAALGSVITGVYTDRLDTAGLPPAAADAATDSVAAAHTVAGRLHDAALTRSADAAYVHGMDTALLVTAVAALAAAALVAAFLPGSRPARTERTTRAVVDETIDA